MLGVNENSACTFQGRRQLLTTGGGGGLICEKHSIRSNTAGGLGAL